MLTLKPQNHHPPETRENFVLEKIYTLEQLIQHCQQDKFNSAKNSFAQSFAHLIPLNESRYDYTKLKLTDNLNPHTEFLEHYEKTITHNKDGSIRGIKKKIDYTYEFGEQHLDRLINQLPLIIAKHLYACDFFSTQKAKQHYRQQMENHLQKIIDHREKIITIMTEKVYKEFEQYQHQRQKLQFSPNISELETKKDLQKNIFEHDKQFLQQIKDQFNLNHIQPFRLKEILTSKEKILEYIETEIKNKINPTGQLAEIFLAFGITHLNYQLEKYQRQEKQISITPATLKLDHNKIDAFLNTEIETKKSDKPLDQIKTEFFSNHKIFDSRLYKYFSFKQNPDRTITIFHHLPIQITTSHHPHPYKFKDIYQHNGILINLSLEDTRTLLLDEQTLTKKYILQKIFSQIQDQSDHFKLQKFTRSKFGQNIPFIRHLVPHNTKFILATKLAKEILNLPKTILNNNIVKN